MCSADYSILRSFCVSTILAISACWESLSCLPYSEFIGIVSEKATGVSVEEAMVF